MLSKFNEVPHITFNNYFIRVILHLCFENVESKDVNYGAKAQSIVVEGEYFKKLFKSAFHCSMKEVSSYS